MNLRDRLFGDDDDEDRSGDQGPRADFIDPHVNMDEVAEHGVNTDEDKEDDGPIDKPTP